MFRTILYLSTLLLVILSGCDEDEKEPQLTVATLTAQGMPAMLSGPMYILTDRLDNLYFFSNRSYLQKVYSDGQYSELEEFRSPSHDVTVRFVGLALEPNNDILAAYETHIGDGPYGLARFKVGSTQNLLYTSTHSMLSAVATDNAGNIYIGTWISGVKKLDRASNELIPFAGGTQFGFSDGTGTSARFAQISDLSTDAAGNLYVCDYGNHSIRKITPAGNVTTIAGAGEAGFKDGQGTEAKFYQPSGIAVDPDGNIYVADTGNHSIRKITPQGNVTTIAGNGTAGYVDGNSQNAQFNSPVDVTLNSAREIFVTDTGNNRIRVIR